MRKIYLFLILSIFSCKYEKYEPSAGSSPLAECIDGHAKFTLDGKDYEYECDNYDLVGYVSLDEMNAESGNDCWGWTDPNNGKEYALMGLDNGTAIVDISTPNSPTYLGKIPTETDPSSWRDLKVYDNHVFIVSEAAGHGMQVFNLEQLRGLDSQQNFSADYVYSGYGHSHNIAINTESGYAYTAGAGSTNDPVGIHALNISNPTSPTLELELPDFGYSHDAQIVNYRGPDSDHTGKEIYMGSNETKVVFVDVTDKNDPKLISEFLYDDEYTHQSWLTEDHRYALLGDELDELDQSAQPWVLKENAQSRTIVIDLNDLDNPILHFNYLSNTEAIDHNGYIVDSNFYLANYTSGLRVIDIINIEQKSFTETGYFDTHIDDHTHNIIHQNSPRWSDPGDHTGAKGDEIEAFNGAWSVYPFFNSENIIISDINSGLFIVKKKAN
jgi:choice-of-anchor B domain-containing protein